MIIHRHYGRHIVNDEGGEQCSINNDAADAHITPTMPMDTQPIDSIDMASLTIKVVLTNVELVPSHSEKLIVTR
jgi:hypothetical protein